MESTSKQVIPLINIKITPYIVSASKLNSNDEKILQFDLSHDSDDGLEKLNNEQISFRMVT